MIRFFTTVSIHDVGTAFRAYRREIAQDIHILGENHLNLPIIASMVGAQLDEVIIKNVPRGTGESSFTLHRTLNVALDIFFVAFFTRYIDRPIRIFGKVAAVLFALATLIACILAWQALVEGIPVVREHSGWFNMSFIIYIISIQVMLTGILAEVLTQLHYQPGRRESYRVRQVYKTPPSSNDLSGDEAD